MTKHIELKTVNQGTALATGTLALPPLVIEGLEEFKGSFDRLCLQAGTAAIEAMLAADAEQLCGKRYQRHADRQGHRWGMIDSEVGWHGGKAAIRRPRVRQRGGAELELPNWTAIQKAELLSRWAFNQMLIGVATRKYARSVRLPDGDLAGQAKRATTKSSVSRRFVALSTAKLKEWLAADLSALDLLVIQIDGLRVGDHVLVAAIGIDGAGDKHVLARGLGGDGERRRSQGVAGRPDRARVATGYCPLVHRRWRQGAEPGRTRHLRGLRADPALPSAQGTQYRRAARPVAARRSQEGTASGLGQSDRRAGRAGSQEPGASARS